MGKLSISDLTKVYETDEMEEIVAVDGLDLEIEDGEFVVLVGPSGCGKTTTLRCIAGLEIPEQATIELDGVDITDDEPADRDMAMVFQNYALYPHMTVRENISFGLRLTGDHSEAEIDERVETATEMLEIDDLLSKTPDQLSGGQKQRVALGRAIVREPEVFLFDEPLSNLDAKLRTTMRTELQQLQNQLGITSIYVTHDQAEAMTMSDRIVILEGGQLQQVGTPEDVYNEPTNQFVAGFIGDPSMNFIESELTTVNSGQGLAFGDDVYAVSGAIADLLREVETVTAGVRPENIRIVGPTDSVPDRKTVTAEVKVLEPMGDENLIYYDVGDTEFVSKVSPRTKPSIGHEIRVTFDEADLYLFDEAGTTIKSKQTEEAIPS
jgi:multiple sugar transport system ATP-binding protein